MSEDNLNNLQNLVQKFFTTVDSNKFNESIEISNKWREILSSIKEKNRDNIYYSAGLKIADHSRIIDLKNGILLIETDHPGWTQKIQFHKKYILIGLKKAFPNLEIKTLAFKLKGDKSILNDIKPSKKEKILEKSISSEEKEMIIKDVENKIQEIPEDLAKMLNKLKDSILTKE